MSHTTLVHVLFDESQASRYAVFGAIRAGRDDATKAALRCAIAEALAETTHVQASAVNVLTTDMPASWLMEGGSVLPEPGDEDAWLAARARR